MEKKRRKGEIRPVKKTTLYFTPEFHKKLRLAVIQNDLSSMGELIEKSVTEFLARGQKKGGK